MKNGDIVAESGLVTVTVLVFSSIGFCQKNSLLEKC